MRLVIFILVLFAAQFLLCQKLVKFTENYLVGYKDMAGKIVVPNTYEAGSEFENGFAIIIRNSKRGFLNESGQIAIQPQYQDASMFRNGLAAVRQDNLYGYINTNGEWAIRNTFQNAFDFIQGYARVMVQDKWGLIDAKGEFVVKPEFAEMYDNSQGLILARKTSSELYGYMNTNGQWVIPPQYKEAQPFIYTGFTMIKKGEKYYNINTKNEIVEEIQPHKEEWEREGEERNRETK